jgi:hypothetical protein
MINMIKKLIWDISSKIGIFKGKERVLALITRPSSLNQIVIKYRVSCGL